MVVNDEGIHDYPDRDALVGAMMPILKSARSHLSDDWERYGLDEKGFRLLNLLVSRLRAHTYFEHLDGKTIERTIRQELTTYRSSSQRPNARGVAESILDAMAQEPMTRNVYLGLEHLSLPDGTTVGGVQYLATGQHAHLVEAFARFQEAAPTHLACVRATAGTVDLLRDRSRGVVETSLALIRQQTLHGFTAKIYLSQVMFELSGLYAIEGDEFTNTGWWRAKQSAIDLKLDHDNLADWRSELATLSLRYENVAPALRQSVDTCLIWLDVAALSDRWRIIIPAIFSGMEALLVPETVGLKAALVTVRSVAVHVALDKGFFDPGDILRAYELRSELVHGSPTWDVFEKDATEFADFRRLWAFHVLRDYIELAHSLNAQSVKEIVGALDGDASNRVCEWLTQQATPGARKLLEEFRTALSRS